MPYLFITSSLLQVHFVNYTTKIVKMIAAHKLLFNLNILEK